QLPLLTDGASRSKRGSRNSPSAAFRPSKVQRNFVEEPVAHRFDATTLSAAERSWNDEEANKANPCAETLDAHQLGTANPCLRLSIRQASKNAISPRTSRR